MTETTTMRGDMKDRGMIGNWTGETGIGVEGEATQGAVAGAGEGTVRNGVETVKAEITAKAMAAAVPAHGDTRMRMAMHERNLKRRNRRNQRKMELIIQILRLLKQTGSELHLE
ncbi:hypothetical protein IFM89_030490 [Coptis chinensis]|uniref:Uncharacterized protein n=1 Tax=Coptis chinensis TaxID=261450 RepID=A0A835H6X1_9MAGN|nr:hypothetical protein IFM89_030490 [Coptis chinensis]